MADITITERCEMAGAPGKQEGSSRGGTTALSRPGVRQRLYGDVKSVGAALDWLPSASPGRVPPATPEFHLEVCLNLTGRGTLQRGGNDLEIPPGTLTLYRSGRDGANHVREGEQPHRFLLADFSRQFLRTYLGSCDGALHPVVEKFLETGTSAPFMASIQPMPGWETWTRELLQPPVAQAARGLWLQSKVLELSAWSFFQRTGEDELFCDRQKRVARERVARVISLIREHLVEPLSLEQISKSVGCSAFHLSRTFSKETGMSIPQYLRKVRMEKAAELLSSGKCNVTEAALEVGYSSLSHFSQAFCQTMGCCPGLYPLAGKAPRF